MTRIFLDSGFVIALINEADQHHDRASQLSHIYDGHPLILTDAIILEIGNGLAVRYRSEAVGMIRHFLDSSEVEVVSVTRDLLDRAVSVYESHQDKSWGLIDCVSFVVMRDRDLTEALTYDKHFEQAGFRALMRQETR